MLNWLAGRPGLEDLMEIYFFENLLKCVGSSIVLSSLVSCLFSFEPVFKFNSGVIIIPFLVEKDLVA